MRTSHRNSENIIGEKKLAVKMNAACYCCMYAYSKILDNYLVCTTNVTRVLGPAGGVHEGGESRSPIIAAALKSPNHSTPTVLLTCPLHTNSACGKERRILIGPW